MRFSHSSMSTFRQCRFKYYLSYIANKDGGVGRGLIRGSAGHEGLAEWYSNGFDDEKALQVASNSITKNEQVHGQNYEDDWQLVSFILERYFYWAREHERFDKILNVEYEFEVKLGDHVVMGFIDGIVQIGENIWLMEHKFNKRVQVSHIDIDPQMSLYLLAARMSGINARGVLFNVIRMTKGGIAEKEPVKRIQVYRNSEGLEAIKKETIAQLDEMQRFLDDKGQGDLSIYRNCSGDCTWKCGYFNTCLSINDDGDVEGAVQRLKAKPPRHPSKQVQSEVK